jgi:hypothetical protein
LVDTLKTVAKLDDAFRRDELGVFSKTMQTRDIIRLLVMETGHMLNRSGYRIANWFRAVTHSLTALPVFSKLRIAK